MSKNDNMASSNINEEIIDIDVQKTEHSSDSATEAANETITSGKDVRIEYDEKGNSTGNHDLKKSQFYALLEETARIKTEKKSEEKMTSDEKKTIEAYRIILRDLSQLEKENYEIFVHCLLSIYAEKKECRKGVKEIINDKRVKDGVDKYNGCWGECFPLLREINEVMGKDICNATYSFAPKAYLYGNIEKNGNSVNYFAEAKNEKIINIVNALLELDGDIFSEWVYATLGFDQDLLEVIDERKGEVTKERKKLAKQIKSLLAENEKAANIISDSLLKKGYLERLLAFFNTSVKDSETMQKMQEEIDDLTKQLEAGETGRKRQKEMIDERDASIVELSRRVRQFDKLSDELTLRLQELDKKNQIIQLLEGELVAIKEEFFSQKAEHDAKVDALQDENEAFRKQLEATSADLALKNNELERHKESGDKMESKGKQDQAKLLIQGLAEQLNYLTYFYQELKETGSLDVDSIDMYRDVISEIAKVFERIGVVRISDIGNVVTFDSSLYSSMTGPMANGEKATVTGYGWMINGEVVVKATVEREE